MLITGIRHQINDELDTYRSSTFMKYLIHYLHTFALLGMIIPIVIGVDYFCNPKTKEEKVINKFYQVVDNTGQIEYHFYTGSYHFLSDVVFFENTNIEDHVALICTPIFRTVTCVVNRIERIEYRCKPQNVYSWPIIVACLTFICSMIWITKTWGWNRKRKQMKYDSMINLGIINAILCLFIIIATFFNIMH